MTGYTETTVMSSGSWPSIGTYGRTSFHCRDAGSCALSVTTRPTCALSRRSRLDLRCDLRCGDFRDVLANIPDGSIDLILTDPPYPAEFLPLWTALAQFAVAKLAPQGVLAAMSGQTHLPEVIARLGEHLTYRWMIAYRMSGAANVVHARRVSTMWKPVLVYGSTGPTALRRGDLEGSGQGFSRMGPV